MRSRSEHGRVAVGTPDLRDLATTVGEGGDVGRGVGLGELVGQVERVAAAPDVGDAPVDGDEVGEQVPDRPALAGGRRVEREVGADEAGDLVGGAEQGGARVVHGDLLRGVVTGRGGGCHASPIRSRNATHIR